MNFKIKTFNEWKESDAFKMEEYFIDLKNKIEKMFEDESFEGINFDYFEFDSDDLYDVYQANLYFNDTLFEYTMVISIDNKELSEPFSEISADAPVIETPETGQENTELIKKLNIVLKGFNKEDKLQDTEEQTKHIGNITRDINSEELNGDLILELINEFTTEYNNED